MGTNPQVQYTQNHNAPKTCQRLSNLQITKLIVRSKLKSKKLTEYTVFINSFETDKVVGYFFVSNCRGELIKQ
jgi:hypothetical protein